MFATATLLSAMVCLAGQAAGWQGGYDESVVSDAEQIVWLDLVNTDRQTALFDTGSDFIAGPADQVKDIYANLQAQGVIESFETRQLPQGTTYHFPWAQLIEDTVLSFVFNNIVFGIPGNEFQLQYGKKEDRKCIGVVAENSGARAGADWLMGVPFLRTLYTIFDAEQGKIGLY